MAAAFFANGRFSFSYNPVGDLADSAAVQFSFAACCLCDAADEGRESLSITFAKSSSLIAGCKV